jgi:trimeric autotransporter adhesin
MKHFAITLILLSIQISFLTAQVWDSLGGGVKVNNLTGKVGALCIYNSNLIAGGAFVTAGDNIAANSIAQWNGTSWDSIETGPLAVYSLLEYNGKLIAGPGEYGFSSTTIPGYYGDIIGQWNGAFWDTIGPGIIDNMFTHPLMSSLCEYSGSLYAGGYFQGSYDNISYNNIVKWNGVFWDTIPNQYYLGEVNVMAVYNDKLYIGGKYIYTTSNYIACWNDTVLSFPGTGVNGIVYAIAVYNGKLYVGGSFDSAGGMPAKNIAVWDKISWSAVGSGISDTVYTLASYGSALIAGGLFDSAGGISCNKIAQWDGTSWASLGSGITGKGVYALCKNNGNLYVGGEFDSVGGIHANNIAV